MHERRVREEFKKLNKAQRDKQVRERLRTFREAMSTARRDPQEIETLVRKLEVRLRRTGARL